jgi:hypothetical protein
MSEYKLYIANGKVHAKPKSNSQILLDLIKLCQIKGRTITIGTAFPALRYRELREVFPDVLMVVEEMGIKIIGKK